MNKVTIFSNGTEFMLWQDYNCCQCAKSVEVTDPDGTQLPTCPIEYALILASIGDGLIEPEIKNRMNYKFLTGSHRCGEFIKLDLADAEQWAAAVEAY